MNEYFSFSICFWSQLSFNWLSFFVFPLIQLLFFFVYKSADEWVSDDFCSVKMNVLLLYFWL